MTLAYTVTMADSTVRGRRHRAHDIRRLPLAERPWQGTDVTPTQQLDAMLAKFSPGVARLARQALAKLRKATPGSLELVYDNFNALAIGFSPSERPSEGIFSVAIYPRYPTLFFLQGVGLPDPDGVLRGNGRVVRHVVLEDAKTIETPPIRKLMTAALARAKVKLDPKQKRRVIIKSVSAKQRPRRPK